MGVEKGGWNDKRAFHNDADEIQTGSEGEYNSDIRESVINV